MMSSVRRWSSGWLPCLYVQSSDSKWWSCISSHVYIYVCMHVYIYIHTHVWMCLCVEQFMFRRWLCFWFPVVMFMAPCGPRLLHVPTRSGCQHITHTHTHTHAHEHTHTGSLSSLSFPPNFLHRPLNLTHMQSLCFGVWALTLLCVLLASLFSLRLSLSLLSVSLPHSRHTQQTHHHPLNFCPARNAVPHEKYARITTTVLTHTPHSCKHTEGKPLSPKQHASKYSWESRKRYKANMCGQHQALNLGSGIIAGMSQLWFSWSLIPSSDFDYFSSSPSFTVVSH